MSTIVIVGFNIKEENSVYYSKVRKPTESELGRELMTAFRRGSDFVSVRQVIE